MYDQIISTWRWKLREKPKNYRNRKNREVNNAFEMFISYHGKLRKLSVSMKIDQQKIKSLGSTFKNLKLEVEINLWHFHAFLIFSIIMSLLISNSILLCSENIFCKSCALKCLKTCFTAQYIVYLVDYSMRT